MSAVLNTLTLLSMLSLAHAIYSAYESTTLQAAATASSSNSSTRTKSQIPIDIQVQTLISTFALLACIVFSSAPLKPIRWSQWAGGIEKAGTAGKQISGGSSGEITYEPNPYMALEVRRGFYDVRKSREEFARFIREGDVKVRS